MPHIILQEVPMGHIGMILSKLTREQLLKPLVSFIKTL